MKMKESTDTLADGPIEIFIDGSCSLCNREGRWMLRLDRGAGRIVLRDISATDFDANSVGRTLDELMREIHGRTADGRVIKGLEVFRCAYAALGCGWLLAPTGWPVLRQICDLMYRWFAAWRLRYSSGRCSSRVCSVQSKIAPHDTDTGVPSK